MAKPRGCTLAITGCALALVAGCSKPDTTPELTAGSATAPVVPHQRTRDDRREPVIANAPPRRLEVVAGGAPVVWDQARFDSTARYTKGTDGEARDVWSLRELVRHNAGPNARVVSVTGEDGTKPIDAAAWNDPARTPILHTTRRGALKFRWADAEGRWGESEVKDVSKIELAR